MACYTVSKINITFIQVGINFIFPFYVRFFYKTAAFYEICICLTEVEAKGYSGTLFYRNDFLNAFHIHCFETL